jgi:hypothetical protein
MGAFELESRQIRHSVPQLETAGQDLIPTLHVCGLRMAASARRRAVLLAGPADLPPQHPGRHTLLAANPDGTVARALRRPTQARAVAAQVTESGGCFEDESPPPCAPVPLCCQSTACPNPVEVEDVPTIWPRSLMPLAPLNSSPGKVPRSVIRQLSHVVWTAMKLSPLFVSCRAVVVGQRLTKSTRILYK